MEIKLFLALQSTSQIRADTVMMPLDVKRSIKVSTGTVVAVTFARQLQLFIKHLSFTILLIYMNQLVFWFGHGVEYYGNVRIIYILMGDLCEANLIESTIVWENMER